MRTATPRPRVFRPALAATVLALGLVSGLLPCGGAARTAHAQRRGRIYVPPRPVNVESSATIAGLNKALRALGATDRDYGGHREKAIAHVAGAIRHLELPNAKGQSNAAVARAVAGKAAAATTPQAESDAGLRQALKTLFAVHHQLTDKTATRGHLRADAEVRVAIQEISLALKPGPDPATPARPAAR